LTALKPHTSSRSNLSSYLFFIVISGEGGLQYNGKTYQMGEKCCAFIDCNLPYSHSTAQNLWTIKWIHFYGPTLPAVYSKYCERGGRAAFEPVNTTFSSMETVWSELMSVSTSGDYMRDMKINSLLSELLVCLMSESWHPEEKKKASKCKRTSVLEVKEWIDQHYAEDLTLDALSTRVGRSQGRFFILPFLKH